MNIFDTAADVSLADKKTFKEIANDGTTLVKNCNRVRSFNGDVIDILGQAEVTVESVGVTKCLNVLVVKGIALCIYGCDWIKEFEADFKVNAISNNCVVSLQIKAGEMPLFVKPRPLPYGLRDGVKAELDYSHAREWATPIVSIMKPNGDICIFGDYKVADTKSAFERHD